MTRTRYEVGIHFTHFCLSWWPGCVLPGEVESESRIPPGSSPWHPARRPNAFHIMWSRIFDAKLCYVGTYGEFGVKRSRVDYVCTYEKALINLKKRTPFNAWRTEIYWYGSQYVETTTNRRTCMSISLVPGANTTSNHEP